jgi:hypothetical protein
MKSLITTITLLVLATQIQAQLITPSTWCIHDLAMQIDSTGKTYTQITLYNNDIALIDTNQNNLIKVEALISGNDTIKPAGYASDYNYFEHTLRNTYVSYRIDTTIDLSTITGLVLRRAMPGCGLALMEKIVTNQLCNERNPFSMKEIPVYKFQIQPNPCHEYIRITAQEDIELEVAILNETGQIVLEKNTFTNSLLSTAHLPRGIYFLYINKEKANKILFE